MVTRNSVKKRSCYRYVLSHPFTLKRVVVKKYHLQRPLVAFRIVVWRNARIHTYRIVEREIEIPLSRIMCRVFAISWRTIGQLRRDGPRENDACWLVLKARAGPCTGWHRQGGGTGQYHHNLFFDFRHS